MNVSLTRNFLFLLFVFFFGCGGSQEPIGEIEQNTIEENEEQDVLSIMTRCQMLTDVLLQTPTSRNFDLMLTAHYAYEEIYSECLSAVTMAYSDEEERRLNLFLYGIVRLQSIRIGVEALYNLEETQRTCELLEFGITESNSLIEMLNMTPTPANPVINARTLELRVLAADSADFFDAANLDVCAAQK